MAEPDKSKEFGELRSEIRMLRSEVADVRVTLSRLDKAQDLYVDQIQWMRGFCEGQRNQYDKLMRDVLFRDEINRSPRAQGP